MRQSCRHFCLPACRADAGKAATGQQITFPQSIFAVVSVGCLAAVRVGERLVDRKSRGSSYTVKEAYCPASLQLQRRQRRQQRTNKQQKRREKNNLVTAAATAQQLVLIKICYWFPVPFLPRGIGGDSGNKQTNREENSGNKNKSKKVALVAFLHSRGKSIPNTEKAVSVRQCS